MPLSFLSLPINKIVVISPEFWNLSITQFKYGSTGVKIFSHLQTNSKYFYLYKT